MENEYLRVGRIAKAVGLNGEVKVFSTTSFKSIRYKKGNKLFLFIDDKYQEVTVRSYKTKDANFDTIGFEEFTTLEQADALKNIDIYCVKDEKTLAKGQYFFTDLEGCKVVGENNEDVGTVASVEEFPAQITLKVTKGDKVVYVPFIKQFIKKIDIEKKIITIIIIEGLLWNL